MQQNRQENEKKSSSNVLLDVVQKIRGAENILIALSQNPSVDELAAAIAFSFFSEKISKRVTAIYSGSTPNAIHFLNPDATFELNVDTLRDFIIALNKDKADHLRYKVDGDFVKIFITPYRNIVKTDDLEFSYGDFNVDLVISLNVNTAADFDLALSEHGRILHDASSVSLSIKEKSDFAEVEWLDPSRSSICEMVSSILFNLEDENVFIDSDTATSLLTGIVAMTGRFSNERTNPECLMVASKLLERGANQQLISENLGDDSVSGLSISTKSDGLVDSSESASNSGGGDGGSISISHSNDSKLIIDDNTDKMEENKSSVVGAADLSNSVNATPALGDAKLSSNVVDANNINEAFNDGSIKNEVSDANGGDTIGSGTDNLSEAQGDKLNLPNLGEEVGGDELNKMVTSAEMRQDGSVNGLPDVMNNVSFDASQIVDEPNVSTEALKESNEIIENNSVDSSNKDISNTSGVGIGGNNFDSIIDNALSESNNTSVIESASVENNAAFQVPGMPEAPKDESLPEIDFNTGSSSDSYAISSPKKVLQPVDNGETDLGVALTQSLNDMGGNAFGSASMLPPAPAIPVSEVPAMPPVMMDDNSIGGNDSKDSGGFSSLNISPISNNQLPNNTPSVGNSSQSVPGAPSVDVSNPVPVSQIVSNQTSPNVNNDPSSFSIPGM